MYNEESFTVIKLFEQNGRSYMGVDHVKGQSLHTYVQKNTNIQKNVFFDLMRDLASQLSLYHTRKKNRAYQYVNPLSLIISEEEKVYLIDADARENAERIRKMQKQSIREHFLPEEYPFYQKHLCSYDIYGYGKVVQYILSKKTVEPILTKREEVIILKVVRKCLVKQVGFEEVVRNIYPLFRKSSIRQFIDKQILSQKKRFMMLAGGAIVICLFIFIMLFSKKLL